ncbi:hypothetical protein LINGRAHAP2_LOCUS11838, partial [Linum grandiflorum]
MDQSLQSANQFSSEIFRKELCIMILMNGYPLSIVDNLYFKRCCCTLQPLFKVPTRNTIKKDILTLLAWWKKHGEYSTLHDIAMDPLAIPFTSVTEEMDDPIVE